MIELSTGIIERVPVGPGLDLAEQCGARTLRVPNLAVSQQLVLAGHRAALHPTDYQRLCCL